MLELLKRIHNEESGQDIIEYIVIAAVISVAGIALIPKIASKVSNYWVNLNTNLPA